jgi:AraC-like DNA-binding protein
MNTYNITRYTVPSIDSGSDLLIIQYTQAVETTERIDLNLPPFSGLCFNLTGHLEYGRNHSTIPCRKSHFQLLTTGGGTYKLHLSPGKHKLLAIALPLDFLRLFTDGYPAVQRLCDAIIEGTDHDSFAAPHPMTFEMLDTIDQMYARVITAPVLRDSFYYSKIIQLVLHAINQTIRRNKLKYKHNSFYVTLQSVHQLLSNDTSKNWTLDLLADTLHINKKRLVEGFKSLYGVSPIHFYNTKRMERGLALLAETHLSITQVAGKLSYAHTENFTHAFRRHYGYPPSRFRRNGIAHE